MTRRTLVFAITALICALLPAAPAAAAPALGSKALGKKRDATAPGRVLALRGKARSGASIRSFKVYVARGTRAERIRVALYTSRRGRPGERLTAGGKAGLKRGKFNTIRVHARRLKAGRRYWIAVVAKGGRLRSRRPAGGCYAMARRGGLQKRWRHGHRAKCGATVFAPGGVTSPGPPGGSGGLPSPTDGLPPGAQLRPPSHAAVVQAINAPFIRHGRRYTGGANTNEGWGGGSPVVLAAASYAGDTSADAALLAQVRDTIAGGNEPVANGGYPAQHERWVEGMFAIVRHTPRIWSRLSNSERIKIDTLMRGVLIASAFTTSDSNPYLHGGGSQYALDGDDNLNRDWNPNYREGMVGMMLVGAAYFGGGAGAQAVLDGYQPGPFLAQLRSFGFTNMAETFNWKADHPGSPAPSAGQVAAAVRSYRYYGLALTQPMGILRRLADDTYQGHVNCGLNGGAGISTSNGPAGRIDSGCAGLPNKGAAGMLKEFDTSDGGGPRSGASYAYDSYRVGLVNHLTLLTAGLWSPGADANAVLARKRIGVPDLWYKLDHGYVGYANGHIMDVPRGGYVFKSDDPDFAFPYARTLWYDVVAPYHGIN